MTEQYCCTTCSWCGNHVVTIQIDNEEPELACPGCGKKTIMPTDSSET